MKVLHIIPSLEKGGAERITIDIVRDFVKKKGVNVKLVIFRNKIEYNIDDIKDNIKVIPAFVKLSFLKSKREEKIETLQKFLNKFNPDIIHSHLFEADIVSRSCYFPNASWITHLHDNIVQFKKLSLSSCLSKTSIFNFLEKKFLFKRYYINGGNKFIAISENGLSFIKKNQSRYQSVLFPNAINVKRFIKIKSKKRNKSSENIRIINVGSFTKNKNQIFLLEVILELNKMNVNSTLTFLGDGPEKNFVYETAKKLEIISQINFKNKVESVEKYLWESSVYVHAATYEAFGLVILEAMAAELPVVALEAHGNTDLINNGENGYLIKEKDPKLFALKIIASHNNERIKHNAKTHALKYNISTYNEKLMNFYRLQLS